MQLKVLTDLINANQTPIYDCTINTPPQLETATINPTIDSINS